MRRLGFDGWLLAVLLGLSAFGSVFIHSATQSLTGMKADLDRKQLVWLLAGMAAFVLLSFIDYHKYKTRSFVLWAIAIAALIGLLVFATPVKGAKSWIRLAGFSLEPAEFAKVIAALTCADFLSERGERRMGLKELAVLALLVLLPAALTLKQPALGVALTFFPLLGVLTVVAPFPRKLLWGLGITGFVALTGASSYIYQRVLEPHQRERIQTYLDPGADISGKGYHVNQSRIAVGSGGLTGKGLFQGTQTHMNFLPEQHTDFIFSVVCEETGMIGVLVLLSLYGMLFYRALQIAHGAADAFGFYLVAGLAVIPLFQALVNTGMVLGVLPATGITLPFISYGGTSLISLWAAFGLIHSVYRHRFGERTDNPTLR